MEHFGSREEVSIAFGERPSRQACPGAKDGPKGQRMDCRAPAAWSVEGEVCSVRDHSSFAGPDAHAGQDRAERGHLCQPHPEGIGGRQCETGFGGHGCTRSLGARDAEGHDPRATGSKATGAAGTRALAEKTERVAVGFGKVISPNIM